MIIAANPSTLVNLARAGDQEKERLIRDMHDGTLDRDLDVPAEVRAALTPRCAAIPTRHARWRRSLRRTGTLYPKDYWPNELASGQLDRRQRRRLPAALPALLRRHPGARRRPDRQRGPHDDPVSATARRRRARRHDPLLRVHPRGGGRRPSPTVLAAHEVEEGRKYFILPTTAFGLYRYHIHDLVRVTGFHNGTPLLEFLSKGSHFANLTGEKLSEYHVTRACRTCARAGPDADGVQPGAVLGRRAAVLRPVRGAGRPG